MIRVIQAAVLILPLWYCRRAADPFLPPRFFIWSIACLLLLVLAAVRSSAGRGHGGHRLWGEPAFISLLFFAALALVSLAGAVNPGEGLAQWAKTVLLAAFLYGAAAAIDAGPGRIPPLASAVIVSGIALGAIGLGQAGLSSFQNLPGHFTPRATMGNKNLLASALFLHLPFVFYGLSRFRGAWRLAAAAAATLAAVTILAAASRAVWLATAVAGGAVLWTVLRSKEAAPALRPADRGMARPLGGPIRLAVLLCLLVFGGLAARAPWWPPEAGAAASLQERTALWQDSLKMAASSPFFGVGPGQWKIYQPVFGSIRKRFEAHGLPHEVVFQRPHNDFLWILAENGIAGLICHLLFLWFLVRRCQGLIACVEQPEMRQRGICMFFGLIGYLVISFFSFPRERIVHQLFLALLAAVILGAHPRFGGRGLPGPPFRAGRWMEGGLLFLCGACVLLGAGRLSADVQVQKAMLAKDTGAWQEAIAGLDQACAWYYTLDPLGTPLAWHRGMAHHQLGQIDLAWIDFKAACRAHPFHPHSRDNAAACAAALSGQR